MVRRKEKTRTHKTLYLSREGLPLRVTISKRTIKNFQKVQKELRKLFKRPRYFLSAERSFGKWSVRITRYWIDVGFYSLKGWENLVDFKSLDKLPDVYFSERFMYYAKGFKKRSFRGVIKPKDLKYFFAKLLEG